MPVQEASLTTDEEPSITSTMFDAYNKFKDDPYATAKTLGALLTGLIPTATYQSYKDATKALGAIKAAGDKIPSAKAISEATKYGALIPNSIAKQLGWKTGLKSAILDPVKQIDVPKSMPPVTKGLKAVKGLVKSPFTPLGVTAALMPTEGPATASNVGNLMSGPEPTGFPGLNTTSPNYTSNVLSQPSTSPVGVTPVSVAAPVSVSAPDDGVSDHDPYGHKAAAAAASARKSSMARAAKDRAKAKASKKGGGRSKGRTTAAPASGPHGGGMTSSESAAAGGYGSDPGGEFGGTGGYGGGMGGFGGWT